MVHGMPLKLIAFVGACVLLTTPAVASAYVETPKYAEEFNKQQNEEATRKQKALEEQQAAEERKAVEEHKAAEEHTQHEAAERQQREEAERAEAQAKEESQHKAKEAAASQCVVPALKGETLTVARRALRRAHCKLGHVSSPHHAHGRLVVTRQGLPAAGKHPAGTAITLTLAPAGHRH